MLHSIYGVTSNLFSSCLYVYTMIYLPHNNSCINLLNNFIVLLKSKNNGLYKKSCLSNLSTVF